MLDYPTVLVDHGDEEVHSALVDYLQRSGFHVLEADDWSHVLYWVRVAFKVDPAGVERCKLSKAELMPMPKSALWRHEC